VLPADVHAGAKQNAGHVVVDSTFASADGDTFEFRAQQLAVESE
jgi:hypothetical protein